MKVVLQILTVIVNVPAYNRYKVKARLIKAWLQYGEALASSQTSLRIANHVAASVD